MGARGIFVSWKMVFVIMFIVIYIYIYSFVLWSFLFASFYSFHSRIDLHYWALEYTMYNNAANNNFNNAANNNFRLRIEIVIFLLLKSSTTENLASHGLEQGQQQLQVHNKGT
ncbi:hypothetical protein ACJX0J_040218, partial [Zea mays]